MTNPEIRPSGSDPIAFTQRPDILRQYSISLQVVDSVHNQEEGCRFCCTSGIDMTRFNARIAANVFAISNANVAECAECCLGCIVYVLDNRMDISPTHPVVINVARGVR